MTPDFDQASIEVLFEQAAEGLKTLEREYAESVRTLKPTPGFRVGTLNYLVQHRAILDYLAHGFVPMCTRAPDKVYFPIAKPGMNAAAFRELVSKRWLPGLPTARPDVYQVLDSVQRYHPGNEWITAFATLVNSNKHVRLSLMAIAGCDAAVIQLPWGFGMQIGDRGLGGLTIQDTGSLTFRGPHGQELTIRGPQVIERDTQTLVDADLGISILNRTWQEFKFDEFPQQPAIVFLRAVNVECRRIVNRLTPLMSAPAST